MNGKEMEKMVCGDVVQWEDDTLDTGVITKRGPNGVYIKWIVGISAWLDNLDGKNLTHRPDLSK